MNSLLRRRYGNPCHECGYNWDIELETASQVVTTMPDRYAELVAGLSGVERCPGLDWNVTAYVWHVVDNTRIWAERLASLALGATGPVVPYDESALASVRGYSELSLQGSLWSLHRATDDWATALVLTATKTSMTMLHPELGELPIIEVARTVGHEAAHHAFDLGRFKPE